MSDTAGYSGTPLADKLGLKDGQAVVFAGLPRSLSWLTSARHYLSIEDVQDWREIEGDHLDYIHLFTDSAATIDAAIPALRAMIRADGAIWLSWPKKASGVSSDVTEDTIRDRALQDVLVDVKVCAVDATWSGLKLVIRKEHRA